MKISMIMRTDSYKVTHWPVYPDGMEYLQSYLESRGGDFSSTVFFGLHPLLKYLTVPITMEDIDYAEKRFKLHFNSAFIFNRAMWEHIVKEHNGYLPLQIRAVPEGTVVPTNNVLVTIENTDPKCGPLVNYVETLIMKVWYPISVATFSREIKKIIGAALETSGDIAALPFMLQDFGDRGCTCEEQAMIGGMAHLVNFMGTDNLEAVEGCLEYYGEEMAGFSVPATEHSVMCANGEEGEMRQIERTIDTFKDQSVPAISIVIDSFDMYRTVNEYIGKQLKGKIETITDKMIVLRPDSGVPHVIVRQVVEMVDVAFGHTVNTKGYKLLNHIRVLPGDGINKDEIKLILDALMDRGWSASNIACFGMGGKLLQNVNRDTQKFAIKASSITINGRQNDVQKRPVTDNSKRSKAGRLKLVEVDGVLQTVVVTEIGHDILETVFENGKILVTPKLSEIRERAALNTAPAWL